jgi:hypothetical protein
MFKQFECISKSLLILSLLATPAWAQFEVSPDHFESDQDSMTTSAHQTELQGQVRDLQAQIVSNQARIRAKSEMVEDARQESISAGIQGDGAGTYLEAYRLQQEQLELLLQSLTTQIALARNTITDLETQFTLYAAKTNALQPLYNRKHNAKLLMLARATRPPVNSR